MIYSPSEKVVCIKPFVGGDLDIDESRATPNPVPGSIYCVHHIEKSEDGEGSLFLVGMCGGHIRSGDYQGEEVGYCAANFRKVAPSSKASTKSEAR